MTDNETRRALPPSFTPASGRSGRPTSGDEAITVGPTGAAEASGAGQDAAHGAGVPPAPRPPSRVTRVSSQPVPVRTPRGSTSAKRAAQPGSRPGARSTARPVAADTAARPAERPSAPARSGGDGTGAGSSIRIRKGRIAAIVGVLVLVLLLAWPIGLVVWANGKIDHVAALSDAAGTPGTTYLIAGSDSRADGPIKDGTSGARTDTIMLLQVPKSGTTSLISIPRDSYVAIPGHGHNKINAAYSYGGAPLLVKTVENLTGMTVDHYAEVGFSGVEDIVDAVGKVHLCMDYSVNDKKSELKWKKGCHDVGGKQALAFSRMRYADPAGDFGRTDRQRQLVDAIAQKAENPSLLFNPFKQVSLIKAGTGVLHVDNGTNIIDIGKLAKAFKTASGPKGATGFPPIISQNYQPGGVGSTVELDPKKTPVFFKKMMNGTLKPGKVNPIGNN